MPSSLISALSPKAPNPNPYRQNKKNPLQISLGFLRISTSDRNFSASSRSRSSSLIGFCLKGTEKQFDAEFTNRDLEAEGRLNVEIGNPRIPSYLQASKMSLGDQAFFLLAFVACTTSIAFTSLVVVAVPTLHAMGRAAISLSKLADTTREELPSTMAAIRLSGMEISDLTLELNDLSQEVADGVRKSAQTVQAAEAGIRQIGTLARHHTMSMINERACLPTISLQPVVAGAARKTSNAVGRARKTFMNIISRGELNSEDEKNESDRVEI
ncbi:uncharacterized protein LOC143862464 [Tasmannia lanceolata]|uniref:uncharacterized protein LOC143862464 n=1 Tax=Tasmannia lanceolata TaxID=3420 RepID=UPI0040643426